MKPQPCPDRIHYLTSRIEFLFDKLATLDIDKPEFIQTQEQMRAAAMEYHSRTGNYYKRRISGSVIMHNE